jgi:hypothetical protein
LSIPSSPSRGALVLCATALLTGLAAGALCCLLALVIKQDPIWLMLPVAIIIGAFMRWQRFDGARGATAAAGAMLLCIVYTEYLYAAVRMADMLGFPLRDTLFRMDWRFAWQIVRGNSGVVEAAVLVLAPAIAAGISARTSRGSSDV